MNTNEKCQMEFDLDSTYEEKRTIGYEVWRDNNKQKHAQIAETWHLPVFKRVRVKLKWRPDELTGVLALQEFPSRLSPQMPLKLRVDGCCFDNTEIEYCHQAIREDK